MVTDIVCTGRGADGGHCCWIDGKVCEFLVYDGDLPRCGIWGEWDTEKWRDSPVGRMFAELWPWKTCQDWPQNIPEVMAKADITGPFGLCCWGRGNA